MIETRRLSKTFTSRKRGRVDALRNFSLTCRTGEVYALLGPNGAGKTTAIRILATLLTPTSGEALVCGCCVVRQAAAVRRQIGVVSYETGVYERMTPREIGRYIGRLNDLQDHEIDAALEAVFALLDMSEIADERTDSFSTGMKQKTVIMRALVTTPNVLIFDEPTAGLDVLAAKGVLDHIRLMKGRGTTVLFSTHVLWEAETLADRIGIINGGALVAEGTLQELRERTGHGDLEDIFFSLVR